MKKSTLILLILGVILLVGIIGAFRLLTAAVKVVSSGFNTVLGIVLIAALIVIVIWMFGYASKKKK